MQFVWFLHWWPFALAHHIDPFVTKYVWFPEGDNFAWKTSVPFAALLMAPITAIGGPVLAFNVLTLSAPALAAWTAFLLIKHITRDWIAALFGGYLFGFSSYELGHLLAHLNLDMIFLIPVAVLLSILRVQRKISPWLFVFLLALVFLAQLGISSEILATLCLFGAITWLLFLLNAPYDDRAGLWMLSYEIPAAFMAMVILAMPFEMSLIRGFGLYPATPNSPIGFSSDLLNFITPTSITRIGRSAYAPLSGTFGDYSGAGAYLGLPLIGILIFYFRQITRPYVLALLATTCLLAVFSLGPVLHIGGLTAGLPMPWRIALHLPLINAALPQRFTMYVALSTAIAAALWLAVPAALPQRMAKLALAAIACLFLVPNTALVRWTTWPADPFFTPSHVREALGKDPNVLILPYSYYGPGMAWQSDADFSFTQSGGYTGSIPLSEENWPIQPELETGNLSPTFPAELSTFIAAHKIAYILIGPGTPASVAKAVEAQGWPKRQDGDVEVVKTPQHGVGTRPSTPPV
jgi:hypothetical protein